MHQPTCYLAGPIAHITWETATDWRVLVSTELEKYGIMSFSPLRGKSHLKGRGALGAKSEEVHPLTTQRGITGRDSFDINRSDLIFVNLLGAQRISVGTVWELGIAYQLQKIVVLVMEKEGNVHDHIMVLGSATYYVNDLETAIGVTKAVLLP